MEIQVMKIAIIGAGNVGKTLGQRFAEVGHEVMLGVRDPDAQKIKDLLDSIPEKIVAGNNQTAAQWAEIVVFTTPWNVTQEAIAQCGNLAGKIVIDCSNPVKLGATEEMLEVGFNNSAGEMVAQWAKGAKVFKTFNQVGYEVMANPIFDGRRAVMFVAGEDSQKETVMNLVEEIGFEALYIGDITLSRILEPFAMSWIHSAIKMGMGRDWAFHVVRR
jgi:predicted dinucleotide-binding enzyme